MKRTYLFIMLFAVLTASAQNKPTDLFLCLGQSNMSGASPIGFLDTVTLQNVYLFNSSNNWELAKNTLTEGTNRYSTVKSATNTLSPAYTFSRKIATYTNKKIGIVSNARGATTVSWWQKGYTGENDYDLYEGAIAQAKAALLATPGAKIKGILWLQGEGDNGSGSSKEYMSRLQQLVSDLRADLNDNTIPFIAGEVGQWMGRGLGVNPVIRTIKENIPYSDWVTSNGLTSKNLAANDAHYDNLSQRTYGGRYADKVLELIYNTPLKGVTAFSENDYGGRSVLLGLGEYSAVDLEKMGVLMSEIAALKVDRDFEVQLFSGEIDQSAPVTIFSNNAQVNETISSIRVKARIRPVFSAWQNQATHYLYDFSGPRASGEPSFLAPATVAYAGSSTLASPGWLPAPTSGTGYLRYSSHSSYNGRYDLIPFPNPTSLKVLIANGGPNKLSLIDADGATEISRFSTTLKFGANGTKGLIRLMLGNTNGLSSSGVFTSSSNVATTATATDIFAVLGILYTPTSISLVGRSNPTGIPGPVTVSYPEIENSAFNLGETHQLEVFMNNSLAAQNYTYGTNTLTLPSSSYHIWIDGVQLEVAGSVNFPDAIGGKTELAANKVINAFGFSHLSGDATTPTSEVTFSDIRFDYAVSTLPIVLSSFTAKKQNDAVKLNWTTASEKNNSHFEVLRSANGEDFAAITQISGAGNSDEYRDYTYLDREPLNGDNYYKLRQVDFNGTDSDSEIVAIKFGLKESRSIVIVDGEVLKVIMNTNSYGKGNLAITDMNGRVISNQTLDITPGKSQVNINTLSLTTGVYIAVIKKENQIEYIKFIK